MTGRIAGKEDPNTNAPCDDKEQEYSDHPNPTRQPVRARLSLAQPRTLPGCARFLRLLFRNDTEAPPKVVSFLSSRRKQRLLRVTAHNHLSRARGGAFCKLHVLTPHFCIRCGGLGLGSDKYGHDRRHRWQQGVRCA